LSVSLVSRPFATTWSMKCYTDRQKYNGNRSHTCCYNRHNRLQETVSICLPLLMQMDFIWNTDAKESLHEPIIAALDK